MVRWVNEFTESVYRYKGQQVDTFSVDASISIVSMFFYSISFDVSWVKCILI